MTDWRKWHERARAKKKESGTTDSILAAAIVQRLDELKLPFPVRNAERAQVNHWFTGKREPTLSQFMVLCEMLGADPGQILFGVPAIRQNSPIVDKALTSDPTTNGRYAMQEKRLKPRRIVKA